MKLIKEISNKTYIGKNGKTYHYQNYSIVLQNGVKVQIKPVFSNHYNKLDAIAEIYDNRKK